MLGRHFRSAWQNQSGEIHVRLIGGFQAINHGAAHQGDLAAVSLDFFVCQDAPDRHWQVEFHHIACLPSPLQMHITVLAWRGIGLLAVDR